ncbi:MAG: VWA domain-containing protein [Microscillaceae bacterium]|nr:VWA domain-containing protein [Microscillaceae bacterium]
MVITALARPQMSNQRIEQSSEGIDIVLIFDISESMRIEDFSPNRLEAAKKIGVDFIRGRQYDRIGLVLFAGKAYSLAPLTTDYAMLETYLQSLNPYMIPESGTAIGDALGVATNRLRDSKAVSKVMVMISDGDNSAGSLDPLTAAQLAAYYGIKIYAILVGQEGTVPMPTKLFGGKKYVENTIDEKTMRQIAAASEGLFFRASDNQALAQIFERINQLEKTEITETRFQVTEDYYPVYLRWALIFWLLWLFSKSTFMANVLED